jgi:transposase
LYRKTGSFLPAACTGRVSVITKTKIEEIRAAIKIQPDITLNELIEKLSLPIQKSQLSRLLISLGYSFKKRQHIRPSKTAPISKKSERNSKKR